MVMEMTARKRTGLFKTDGWKRFKKNKLALVGTAVICVMILAAVFAPVITQHSNASASARPGDMAFLKGP